MKLGIDLGTTRTVVAYADRGNYPVVTFDDEDGDATEHFPSVVALQDGALVYGFDAIVAARNGAPLVRSFKRALAAADVNADTPVTIGGATFPLLHVMTGFVRALLDALATRSNLPKPTAKSAKAAFSKGGKRDAAAARADGERSAKGAKKSSASKRDDGSTPPQAAYSAVVAVPAHAHAAQRFLTLEAFKAAGVDVLALLNEPSAAGFEYTHRLARTVSSNRTRVVVYDLGGGTFDASLVRVDGAHHDVVATAGDNRLGGDDFDEALARCAAKAAGKSYEKLSAADRAKLLQACREAKESLGPNKRKITIDAPFVATVLVDDFYEAASPLVERSVRVMAPLLARLDAEAARDGEAAPVDEDDDDDDREAGEGAGLGRLAGIYLVGGGSGLPLVSRVLKERFGRRVHRSAYPGASTAIGLAIASDDESGYSLTDRYARSFGVFRERDGGKRLSFDSIVTADAVLPDALGDGDGADRVLVARRRYRAAHNVGWFRFVECPSVDAGGEPKGDLLPFGEVVFPFDARLRGLNDLRGVPVERKSDGPVIEERYLLDKSGLVEVEIQDVDAGFTRTFRLGAQA